MTTIVVKMPDGRLSKPISETELRKLRHAGKLAGTTEARYRDGAAFMTVDELLSESEQDRLPEIIPKPVSGIPVSRSTIARPALSAGAKDATAEHDYEDDEDDEVDPTERLKSARGRYWFLDLAAVLCFASAVVLTVLVLTIQDSDDSRDKNLLTVSAVAGAVSSVLSGVILWTIASIAAHVVATWELAVENEQSP